MTRSLKVDARALEKRKINFSWPYLNRTLFRIRKIRLITLKHNFRAQLMLAVAPVHELLNSSLENLISNLPWIPDRVLKVNTINYKERVRQVRDFSVKIK